MTDETLTDEEFWTEFNLLFAEEKLEASKEEIEKITELADLEKIKHSRYALRSWKTAA